MIGFGSLTANRVPGFCWNLSLTAWDLSRPYSIAGEIRVFLLNFSNRNNSRNQNFSIASVSVFWALFRVGFWQNGFFVDFYFCAAGFFRGFCRRIFSPHFCGKKCPEKSSRKIPGKILQNLYNKNPRQLSAEGLGQHFRSHWRNVIIGRFFQWAFSMATATIVSGGVAERINFPCYVTYCACMTGW